MIIKIPFVAITFWPFIFIFDYFKNDKKLLNHEKIHLKQQEELLLIGFYLLYILFFIMNLFRFKNLLEAYENIPFEIEAKQFETDLNYLQNRNHFNWIKSFAR